jgi:hypothetical protein
MLFTLDCRSQFLINKFLEGRIKPFLEFNAVPPELSLRNIVGPTFFMVFE